MRVRALVVLLAINAAGIIIAGCAGNASPKPPVSAPKIVAPPVSQTVAAGQSATFSVTATGAAPLSYQWNKNGTSLIGATSSNYITPPVAFADSGAQFSVVVSNSLGSLATTAPTLTVNSPPAITAQPSSQTVTAGQSATFSVAATGNAPLTYQWNKNGTAISGATAATYTMLATTTADSGAQFNVVVNNAFGNAASNPAALTVNPLMIAAAITSANSTVLSAGTAGMFTVTATGSPTVSLTETGALPSGVTFTDNGNGTGTLTGTPAAGSGKAYSITFTASNGVGSPASQSFALTVNEAPAITSRNSTVFALGTSELFAVLTKGFPAPSLTETGALPSGVTFTDNGNGSGKLAGIATTGAGKTFPITLTASNGIGSQTTQSFTLTVDQGPGISSPNNTAFTVGTPGSFAVIATGFPTPAFTETGALPNGVTFTDGGNGVGTLSGTPAAGTGGTYSVVFMATNGVGTPANQAFTLTVGATPVVTSASNATFAVGTLGTFSVTATGTPAPSLTETGTLPSGATFVDNHNGTATLSGNPAAGSGGTYPITIQAASSSGSASQNFTLNVTESVAITSASSTTFTVGAPGTFSVTATGAPNPSLTEVGALPSGVTFADNHNGTGTLSGTPAASTGKTYSITLTATNGMGSPVSQTFTLTVNQAPTISSPSSTTFTVGSSGSFTVSTTGFPASSLTETGTLPSGVTFKDNGNGTATLNGTPASGMSGTYAITFTATNGVGTAASQTFTLTVSNPNSGAVITSGSSTTFTMGAVGTFSVTTTGTPTPTLTETGTLPGGVTFKDNGNGTATISGTPASGSSGTYPITFTATNGVGTPATQTFILTVNQAPAITSPNSTTFNAGTSASFTVLTTGFPAPSLTEAGALPSGVTFKDNGNGTATLSGTPATGSAGAYSLTFTATNGVGTPAAQTFTLAVNPASAGPVITSASSATFTVGTAGTFSVTTTGTPAPSLTETGALPTGVTFKDNGNGTATLGGIPAGATGGTYAITIGATNSSGSTSQSFTLNVDQSPAITSANGASFAVGTAGSFTVTTAGFPAASLIETGPLPNGVTFKDNGNGTATLSGTPAAGSAASFSLTFTATNGVGTAATQTFTLTVTTGATGITCGSGHEAAMNGQYAFFFQGFDTNGPVAIAGTFSADGTGKVALLVGVEDINTSTGVQTNVPINSASSSYSVGADNRGCLTIATSSGTSKYAFALGSLNTSSVAARGRMIEVDSTGTLGSGVLRLQDPATFAAAISGSFNFDVTSTLSLSTTAANRFAMVGTITASGGVITSGEADFNLSGSLDGGAAGPLAITNGTYSVSSNGRGALTFDVAGAGTFHESIYIVSATEFYLMAIDAQSPSNPTSAGTAHAQTGPFTTSSLSGGSVFYSSGLCAGCGPGSTVAPDLSVGVINVPTAGTFTLTGDENQGGTLTTKSLTGTYTVDSAGRVQMQSGGSASYIFYLEAANRGFLLSTGNESGEGFLDPQKGSPFTNSSLNVTLAMGTSDQTEQNVVDSSGVATFSGLGTVSGTMDSVALGTAPSSNAFSRSYSVTNGTNTPGRGTITSNGATISVFYIISTTKVIMMDASNSSGGINPNAAITNARQ